mmetsp:Transcript_51877/g.119304  ORF Transcript_51877/g.119304 Transcript_51877/m.119304 type:complete len:227 (+) Transcript_51877:660-1340(+)
MVLSADGLATLWALGLLHGAATFTNEIWVAIWALVPVERRVTCSVGSSTHGLYHLAQLLLRELRLKNLFDLSGLGAIGITQLGRFENGVKHISSLVVEGGLAARPDGLCPDRSKRARKQQADRSCAQASIRLGSNCQCVVEDWSILFKKASRLCFFFIVEGSQSRSDDFTETHECAQQRRLVRSWHETLLAPKCCFEDPLGRRMAQQVLEDLCKLFLLPCQVRRLH